MEGARTSARAAVAAARHRPHPLLGDAAAAALERVEAEEGERGAPASG